MLSLKVHKIENFFYFDFGICIISLHPEEVLDLQLCR